VAQSGNFDNRRIRLYENGNITITRFSWGNIENPDNINYSKDPEKVEAGKKTKTFYLNNRHYRSVSSSAVKLWNKKVNKIIFVTLTFPEQIDEKRANICFSKFVENLKVTYHLNKYIAVKELTEAKRPHYHCLFDLPFTDVYKLNRAWNKTFKDFMPGSGNSLRLGSPQYGTIVKDINRCVKYLTKYMSKVRGSRYEARCIFMSRDLKSDPVDIEEAELRQLITEYSWRALKYEYCTVILLKNTIRNNKKFMRWFTENSQKIISYEHNFT